MTLDQSMQNLTNEKIVLVRNFQGLPEKNCSNDIDIIVRQAKVTQWTIAISTTSKILELDVYRTAGSYYYLSYSICSPNSQNLVAKIDINYSFNWRGVIFADLDEILDDITLYSQPIYIVSDPTNRAIITFFHSFLYGGFINQRYVSQFRAAALRNDGFLLALSKVFGLKFSDEIIKCILSEYPVMSRHRVNALRFAAIFRSIGKSPSDFLSNASSSLFRK